MGVRRIDTPYWIAFYLPEMEGADGGPERCGKWMSTFDEDGRAWMEDVCRRAAESGAACQAKLSTPLQVERHGQGTGVACFYIDGTSIDQHMRLLSFMLSECLFEKDADGVLVDSDFKFDWQTAAGLYTAEDGYEPVFMLSDFVELPSGAFRR